MKNMTPRVAQMTQLLELHFWKTIKLSINHNSKNQRFKYQCGRKCEFSTK